MKQNKSIKRIAALILAIITCMAMAIPVFAAPTDYQIIIDNAVKGETYTAYKIFDVTYANENGEYTPVTPATDIPGTADPGQQYTAYAYTINSSSEWWSVVTTENGSSKVPGTVNVGTTFNANGLKFTKNTVANEWNVEALDSFDAAAFAALLNDNKSGKTAAASAAATDGTNQHTGYATGSLTLNVGDTGAGYYFVDTTTGSLCSLDTTENTATIREKNSLPTQDKSVSDTANGTYGDSISANIGDTVYFQIDVTDGTGTDSAITVHDTMAPGLTLNTASFTVQANTGTGGAFVDVPAGNYEISTTGLTDDCTFEIIISADYIKSLDTGKIIRIKYNAVLNADAVIAQTGNPNTSKVEYAHQMSTEDTATVYTYAGAIYKVDGTTSGTAPELANATFAVTDSTGAPVKLTQVQAGSAEAPAIYKCDPAGSGNSIVTPASGAVVLLGFKDNTVLTLTETAAPTGYNMLTSAVTLTIKAQNAATVEKSATTTGGGTATFVAGTDDGGYQIHADSIDIIENLSGSELPSTGGIGTTIFYIIGGVIVLGAVILLIARRRVKANK